MTFEKILTGQSTNHLVEVEKSLVNQEIASDLKALQQAAKNAGFSLSIASSFRGFDQQLSIWNAKFSGTRKLLDSKSQPLDVITLSSQQKIVAILRWSALPGASRHHWGTDLDVFASNLLPTNTQLQLEPWEYFSGHQAPFYTWLKAHLEHYGFFLPYAKDKGGIAMEPWHISHWSSSQQLQKSFNINLLHNAISDADILGKATILSMLNDIYPRFVTNICHASSHLIDTANLNKLNGDDLYD